MVRLYPRASLALDLKLAARDNQIPPHFCFASASFFSCRHETRTNAVLRPVISQNSRGVPGVH